MAGRKAIYKPEVLKIGEKMQLTGVGTLFAHQYIRNFKKRFPKRDFKRVEKDGKVYVERIK